MDGSSRVVVQKIDGCKLALEGAHITVLPRMAFAVSSIVRRSRINNLAIMFQYCSSRRKMSPNADVKWQGA